MTTKKLTKLLALYLPYILLGLVATNFGEAWRLAEGKELGDKIMAMMGTIPVAFANPLPSLHPLDLLVGLCSGAGLPQSTGRDAGAGSGAEKRRTIFCRGKASTGERADSINADCRELTVSGRFPAFFAFSFSIGNNVI